MVVTLLQTFLEDCPGRLAALEHAVRQGNAKAIESAAHAFKSGSGTIRATFLAGQLASLEADAHEGRLETIPAALERIRVEQVTVMRELEAAVNNVN
jgi:HPt (histidine-containing phosphotransfer) domain-containing protein